MAPVLILSPITNILQPFYYCILPALKVNRYLPNELLSIPTYMGGLDLKAIEIEQGIKAITMIISTYKSPLPTSKLFIQSLEFIQLKVGLDKPILLNDFT